MKRYAELIGNYKNLRIKSLKDNKLDSSAEGIIMRSGQPFAMRYPLMEVEGNGGNLMQSGNWAASRYTGARLSDFSVLMFDDINKDTISDWRDNYDDTEKYPSVLPSKGFYNIVNGTSGIGVGVASSIPQFNIKDVNKALEVLLLNPNATFEEIYCVPDFATGGYLINEKEVKEALKYGSKKEAKKNEEIGAACKLRAKIDYDKKDNCLIVSEIPYSVYTNTICGQLEAIINDESNNPGIDRFNDLTGVKPLIKIYLNKGVDPYRMISFLYKNTSLQYHYSINMTMLDKGRFPKVFTWKEALQAHIDHEKEVYRRSFEFDLKKIAARIHIIDGLLICLASIDEVVKTIKSSSSTAEAKENLKNKFLLDEEQAKAVLDMKLSRLAHLEVQKLVNEKDDLLKEQDRINKILNNVELFNNELIKTWREVANKYGDEHRTKVITVAETKEEKEIEDVKPENVVVITTKSGLIKRIPAESFRVQRRNTKGIKSEDDVILSTIKTNTIDTMIFFTDKGMMYSTIVNNIPSGTNATKGIHISNLVKLAAGENIMAVSSLYRKSIPKYIIFITEKGYIKKSNLNEYIRINRKSGIKALNLEEDDKLVTALFQDDEDLLLISKKGMSIRFRTSDINPIGRAARGVSGMKLAEGDSIIAAMSVHKETDNVAIVCKNGCGKKVTLSDFQLQGRNGKGTICSDTEVAGATMVDDNDNILIMGKPNNVCISVKDIPLLGKRGLGNILIKGSTISKITKI